MIRNYAKLSVKESMLINVNDANKKGIATGNMVRMFSDMGEILVGTLATHHSRACYSYLQRRMV